MTEKTMIRIRSAGILFGLLQIFTYPDPFPRESRLLAVWTMALLALGNLLIWMFCRRPDSQRKQILSVLSFGLDAAVLIGITFVFTFDRLTVMWALLYFLPLEGALRWGQRGAMAAMGLVTLGYTLREIYGANAFGHEFEWTSISFRMGIGFMIAWVSGATASNLMKDRKRLEAVVGELSQNRQLLAQAQQIAHVGSWIWNIEEDRIEWSDELHRIYETEADTRIGYGQFLEPIHPDDRPAVTAAVSASFRSGEPFSFEHRIIRASGEIRTLQCRGEVEMKNGVAVRMVGTGQDITEQKLVEQQLQEAYDKEREAVGQLTELDKQKSDFLSTVAHELRTPLTSIGGFAATLIERWGELPEDSRHHFTSRIRSGAEQLKRLIDELLDFSRLERSEPIVNPVETRLRSTLEAMLLVREDLFANHHIYLQIPEDTVVMADGHALERIVENLLTNSVKFSPPGSAITISAAPGRRSRSRSQGVSASEVVVKVEDQGVGISQEDSARIFERFYRVNRDDVSPSGAGIGLAIVKDLVKAMGGNVWAAPRESGGTVVSFTLFSPDLVTSDAGRGRLEELSYSPGRPAPA